MHLLNQKARPTDVQTYQMSLLYNARLRPGRDQPAVCAITPGIRSICRGLSDIAQYQLMRDSPRPSIIPDPEQGCSKPLEEITSRSRTLPDKASAAHNPQRHRALQSTCSSVRLVRWFVKVHVSATADSTAHQGACRQRPAGLGAWGRDAQRHGRHQPEHPIRSSSRLRLDVRPRRASVADETRTKAAIRDDACGDAVCGRIEVHPRGRAT